MLTRSVLPRSLIEGSLLVDEWFVKAIARRETLLPSLLPPISDERQELLQKTFERKLPWTDMETQYYDAVSLSVVLSFIITLPV